MQYHEARVRRIQNQAYNVSNYRLTQNDSWELKERILRLKSEGFRFVGPLSEVDDLKIVLKNRDFSHTIDVHPLGIRRVLFRMLQPKHFREVLEAVPEIEKLPK